MGVNPLYFGSSARQLYGAYEEPAPEASPRDTAVVLAYPAFPEYNKAHWVFRRLAQRTAQEGFFTLRFDYFATGDSAGPSDAGSLAQWAEDIATAADEALDLSGAREVSIVGFRLGASLAARAVEAGLEVRGLVLWDPVVTGADYIARMLARARIQRRVRLLSQRRPPGQLLGYPVSDELYRSIEDVDLTGITLSKAGRVEIVSTGDDTGLHELVAHLELHGETVELTTVEAEASGPKGRESVRMSTEPLDDIVGALLRTEAA